FNVYARFYGHPAWTRVVTRSLGTNLNPELGPDAPVTISPTARFTADTGDLFQVAMTSVDKAGNESDPIRVLSGATRPAEVAVFDADVSYGNSGANLFSTGGGITIDRNVTWGPALGKVIVVKGALRLKPGVTLTVLPGTIVAFEHTYYPRESYSPVENPPVMGQGAVIVPAGARLIAKGTADKPIIVTKTGDPKAGPAWAGSGDVFTAGPLDEDWYGVVAAPGATVVHSYVRLRYADHGFLRCAAPGDAFDPCPAVS
ncbi:MAG: hypothetical protein JWL64_1878, partial [Frankiales bacterium]|nr:hypothetical protein [Frankiales bacterium]